jgi:uncharacterized membrane protein YoaK (UPF0700 family)
MQGRATQPYAGKSHPPLALTTGEKAAVAITAAWIAGYVDVTGYLLLSHVLTGNMSGNTVHVAIGTATLAWADVVRGGLALAMYVGGLIAAAGVHEAGVRRAFVRTSALVLGLETVLLVVFELIHGGVLQLNSARAASYVSVTLLAFAMGLQNATITRVGALSVKTTHITGTLTEFAAYTSQFLFWLIDRWRAPLTARSASLFGAAVKQKSFRDAILLAMLWFAFFGGGVAGTLANRSWGPMALAPPSVLLVVLILVDLFRPIAASDEHAAPPV